MRKVFGHVMNCLNTPHRHLNLSALVVERKLVNLSINDGGHGPGNTELPNQLYSYRPVPILLETSFVHFFGDASHGARPEAEAPTHSSAITNHSYFLIGWVTSLRWSCVQDFYA